MTDGKLDRYRPSRKHMDQQIKRAAAMALTAEGPLAELYLIHKEICERNRAMSLDPRRKTPTRSRA